MGLIILKMSILLGVAILTQTIYIYNTNDFNNITEFKEYVNKTITETLNVLYKNVGNANTSITNNIKKIIDKVDSDIDNVKTTKYGTMSSDREIIDEGIVGTDSIDTDYYRKKPTKPTKPMMSTLCPGKQFPINKEINFKVKINDIESNNTCYSIIYNDDNDITHPNQTEILDNDINHVENIQFDYETSMENIQVDLIKDGGYPILQIPLINNVSSTKNIRIHEHDLGNIKTLYLKFYKI